MSKGKFTRLLAAAFVASGLTVIPAWSALAVTNPADNPSPITVTGDDGNTYHDGADTLPGYDDEECTYIPGAWFDFANNKVHYADGQWIHWTEWSRASGYSQWLENKNNGTTPTPTPTPTDDATTTVVAGKKGVKTTDKNGKAVIAGTDEAVVDDTEIATPLAAATELGADGLAVSVGLDTNSNPGRTVGLTILASLFGAGVLLLAGSFLRTRFRRGGTN